MAAKIFNRTGCGIMLLFVISANSSMGGLTGLWISKAEFVRTGISNLIYEFKNHKHNLQDDLTLSITTYNETANIHVWPTQLSNIDEYKIEIRALDENTARISAGLEAALQMAQMHDGKTYVVLITDGKDDDRKKTKQAIDTIKHKRNIEYYTYMIDSLNLRHVNFSERNVFVFLGGIPLSSPIVQSFDWWVTRDVSAHSWYEQEEWYEYEINGLSNK